MGVVGYGLAGRVLHGPLIGAAEGLRIAYAVTANPGRMAQVRADHPGVQVLDGIDALWERAAAVDLVVLASPNDVHAEQALEAVRLGLPVVVDKPLGVTSAEGRRVVSAARAAGVPVTVFQNRRWDSDHLTLVALLAEGRLGTVLRYESRFERWRPVARPTAWREQRPYEQGGGILLDLGSHVVDQAMQLFGPVHQVYAEVDARRGAADDDTFMALTHAGGVRSHLWAGALAGAPGPRLRVLGTEAALLVEELDAQEARLRAGRAADATLGAEPPEPPVRLARGEEVEELARRPGEWAGFYPAVAAAVRGEGPVPVDPADAVAVLEVIEAARRSAASGQVVSLSAASSPDPTLGR